MIPIEIVNKILIYVGEINNDIMIMQYEPFAKKEYYIINFNTDLLWKIKATLVMKYIYPIYSDHFTKKSNIELYKNGIPYYENKLRLKLIK
jgi:hypothetical protein